MTDANPNRETLLMWMSAHLDGELGEREQEILFKAMETDPELLIEFEQIASFASLPDTPAAFAPPPTTSGFGPDDQVDFAAALTDSVLAAVAPEAVSDTANGAAQLASLYVDGELNDNQNILRTMERSPAAASAVLGLVSTSEAVGAALSEAPSTPFTQSAVEPIATHVDQAIADDERADILTSAALDGSLREAEARELEELQAAGAGSVGPSFIWAAEAAGVALRASAEDPMAAKAGAAALQAIAAADHQAEAAAKKAEPTLVAQPPLLERVRMWFIPLATAAAAAVAFVVLEGPGVDTDKPLIPSDFFAELIPEEPLDLAAVETIEVLSDNEADVQALDSGATVAAVFSTEAHGITVIWVPEPEESDT
jgi:hypothetical protein